MHMKDAIYMNSSAISCCFLKVSQPTVYKRLENKAD